MKALILFLSFILSASFASAVDSGFRYKDGKCVNDQGDEGYNKQFIGQCSELSGLIFGNFDLTGVDFSGSRMSNTNFSGSTLDECNLTGVNLEGANLSGVSANGADFSNAVLNGAKLTNARMGFAIFENTSAKTTNFYRAKLPFAKINKSSFTQSNMEQVDFRESEITQGYFSKAKLNGANFSKTVIDSSSFEKTEIDKAVFSSSELTDVNFMEAEGSEVNFNQSKFIRGNFFKTRMSNSFFDRVNMTGALATEANFSNSIFSNAKISSKFSKCNFAGSKFNSSDLENSNFEEANLRGIDFTGVNLKSVNLKSTNISNTLLAGAIINDKTLLNEATFNASTTLPFSLAQAKIYGMIFIPVKSPLLIIWDSKTSSLEELKTMIEKEGVEVDYSTVIESSFMGEGLENYQAVLHINGNSYGEAMPREGQEALTRFVNKGGLFIGSAWNGYELSGHQYMDDLILIPYSSGDEGDLVLNKMAGKGGHPLLEDVPDSFRMNCGKTIGALRTFDKYPAETLMYFQNTDEVALAMRRLDQGIVVDLGITLNYSSYVCANDPNIAKIINNALRL